MANTTNQRQQKKDTQNGIVIPLKEYIDDGNKELLEFMRDFKGNTENWRLDLDTKIALLLGMKSDIERLKQDNIAFNAFKEEITSTIKYMKWTYKIAGFVAGSIVGLIAFSEKIKILFFK